MGYVMPSIVGLSFGAARSRLGTVGLRLAVPEAPEVLPEPLVPMVSASPQPDKAIPATVGTPPYRPSGVIVSQSPQPGRRVTRAEMIHVTLSE